MAADVESIEMPEYKLYNYREVRGIETDAVQLLISSMDENDWEVEAILGDVCLFLIGSPTENPYAWTVHNAEVWVDRRAAWDFGDMNLCVAKLQSGGDVAEAIKALVNEYHTHEGTLS